MRLFSKVGVAAVVAASLALTACGSSKNSGSGSNKSGKKAQAASNLNDINPMPYDQVPSGGTLRWPIDSYPPNFNINEIDGNDINISNIMWATLPIVWHFDAGSKPILNTDVVDKAEQTRPARRRSTYHINPKAVWSDGTPITYKDFAGLWQAAERHQQGLQDRLAPTATSRSRAWTRVPPTRTSRWSSRPRTRTGSRCSARSCRPALDATPAAFNTSWVNGPNAVRWPVQDQLDGQDRQDHHPGAQRQVVGQGAQAGQDPVHHDGPVGAGQGAAVRPDRPRRHRLRGGHLRHRQGHPGCHHPQGRWPELAAHRPRQHRPDV